VVIRAAGVVTTDEDDERDIISNDTPPVVTTNEEKGGAMFIRTKVAKGFTYYQVVRSERDGGKVYQVLVASLGRCPTVEEALKAETKRLSRLRRARAAWPIATDDATFAGYSGTLVSRLADQDRWIRESAKRIELLTSVRAALGGEAKARVVTTDPETAP
jgi:hypothetical protein